VVERAVAWWERFWFQPEPTSTLALLRIAFGLAAFAWLATLGHDLDSFFFRDAMAPLDFRSPNGGIWGLFEIFPSNGAVVAMWVVGMLAALCMAVGFRTRLASVIVFLCLLSFERRNPWIFNTGDNLLRLLAFYLMLAPSGVSLSVDRWRAHRDRFWEFPERAPWAMRLIQVQFSMIYTFAVWSKVRGVTWNDGTAVSYAFRLEDLERFHVPEAITTSVFWANLLTYGTLAIELGLGILVWNKAIRPYILVAGLSLHLGIDFAIRVGFFTWAILLPYLAWISPDAASRLIIAARDRALGRRRTSRIASRSGPLTEPAANGVTAASGDPAKEPAPAPARELGQP